MPWITLPPPEVVISSRISGTTVTITKQQPEVLQKKVKLHSIWVWFKNQWNVSFHLVGIKGDLAISYGAAYKQLFFSFFMRKVSWAKQKSCDYGFNNHRYNHSCEYWL